MRILSVLAENFASYSMVYLNMKNRGLTLIQGSTGSGKSTLCDIVPWCLFGSTSKNGSADEVLSWDSTGVTRVLVQLEHNGKQISICRQRGKNKNDLYYVIDLTIVDGLVTEQYIRGRDLNDTQKRINDLLGIDANLYLSGAYHHEFSTTAQFFATTAKNRRLICEQIVDLSLAKNLQLKLSENLKSKSKELANIEYSVNTLNSVINSITKHLQTQTKAIQNWQTNQDSKRVALEAKYDLFERGRKDIIQALDIKLTLHPKCHSCGSEIDKSKHIESINDRVKQEKDRQNPYLEQLAALETETSPGTLLLEQLQEELDKATLEQHDLEGKAYSLKSEVADLEILEEVTDSYRSITIQNAIGFIESSTNELLNKYFDAEIQVSFQTDSADKIDITITKDDNTCSYTQLSKGQRCLLKLCFGISIMKAVSNHSGVNFSQIFFDEALDGMDEQLKAKSYQLLTALNLEYESIFVVEHSNELKNMFENKISVQLVNGHSEIDES